jgi:MFS family permease
VAVWDRAGPASTIAAGVLAAAGLGEIAPASSAVRSAFAMSPFVLGATISLITLIAAVVAAPAGLWLRNRDPRPWLALGLAIMAVAGALMPVTAPSQLALISLRAAQGAGYLLIVVGGPVALVQQMSRERSRAALALWGGCTPAGLAISAAAGGLAGPANWRWWFAALAIACALVAGVVLAAARRRPLTIAADQIPASGPLTRLAGPVRLACGFGLLSLLAVAILSLLPVYLSSHLSLSAAAAGVATSAAAAASIPGNACAAVLLRRGVRPGVLTTSMLLCPVLAFVAFADRASLLITIGAAMALIFAVGVSASAAYASLPAVAGLPEALPLANGILVQFGSAGALIGPPIFAACTGLSHWILVGYLSIPVAVVSTVAMTLAMMADPARMPLRGGAGSRP